MTILLAATFQMLGQHLVERVYISTDKSVYVAGDDMFCSAFCFDMSNGGLSSFSSIAYLELISPEGAVQTGKIALKAGRGGGYMSIPNTVPTGNYRLIGYTSQSFNETGYDYEEGGRIISVFNPLTSARSAAGVEVVNDYPDTQAAPVVSSSTVSLTVNNGIVVTNNGDKPITVSVSMFNDDGILAPDNSGIMSFKDACHPGTQFTETRTADYEGETVRASVRGTTEGEDVAGKLAFLSVPGRSSDIYSAIIDANGDATFFTDNIYGNVEAVLEIGAPELNCHLDIVSPFANVRASGLPKLKLSRSLEDRLKQRSVSMQIQRAQGVDTLYDALPVTQTPLFDDDVVEYVLDDYTRFTLMEELFVEFIKNVSIKKGPDGRELNVSVFDTQRPSSQAQFSSLVLLDGVPVLNQEQIFSYDPLLVEKIQVYHHSFCFGEWYYSGVVNFVTYKKTLPSYTFPENARVLSFQGVSYPVIYNVPARTEGIPDLRQTIFWHPEVNIAPGESRTLGYVLPSYDGHFKVKVEGCDSSGAPVSAECFWQTDK